MKNDTPFLDVKSFVTEEVSRDAFESSAPSRSPFLSLYELEEGGGLIDPETEEYVTFLNEFYDEEFNETLSTLVDEAAAIYETQFLYEREDSQTAAYQAERVLNQHFAPLVAASEAMFETMSRELGQRDLYALTQDEVDTVIAKYHPSVELSPNFENFLGKFVKKAVKAVTNKAVELAKKGASVALGPVFKQVRRIVPAMIAKVLKIAIGKLPPQMQPMARKLAERLPHLKELEEHHMSPLEAAESSEIADIQHEFDQQVASILFARSEVEQELEVTQALSERQVPNTYSLAELDRARDDFVENLRGLKEGEDPAPYIENFIPAILPALKVVISAAGRQNVVKFLAPAVGAFIRPFVGPVHTAALSRAIVDAGLRLIQLEATPEQESRAAASAVAATVEETVRRVAAAPDYVLDDQELFEGFALEAFEQAVAANLPAVLPEATYRKRPNLREGRKLKGFWAKGPRKGHKTFSRKIRTRISPHKVAALETFNGISLEAFLEESLGIEPGEEVEAFMHLYEALPGTRLANIARQEENTPGLGSANGREQLHPLSPAAAALLLGEPEMGREIDSRRLLDPHTTTPGERYYYLEIPGKRPLTVAEPDGRTRPRRPSQMRLILDFPKNEIRVYLFLSEIRAQAIGVQLRQHAHVGAVTTRLHGFIERGVRRGLSGTFGRLKIIHEAVTPNQWTVALQRLPSQVPQVLGGRLTEWVVKGLSDHLKQRAPEVENATGAPADGMTFKITLANPPGFPQLRQALKGKGLSLADLKMSDGAPTTTINIVAGYNRE